MKVRRFTILILTLTFNIVLLTLLMVDNPEHIEAQNPCFNYPNFSTSDGLTLAGDSYISNNRLVLVPALPDKTGGAWYSIKQEVENGFETTFQFQIPNTSSGDGFAFIIQNNSLSELGGNGGNMGYGHVPNSLAIEFDTWDNTEWPDPNNNHISVQTRGTEPNSPHPDYSLGTTTNIPDLDDGNIHSVKIQYESNILSVYLDNFTSPVLSVNINLATTLNLDNSKAWVGFSSGTGSSTPRIHEIIQWSFCSDTLQTYSISGTVLDTDGNPVANVTISDGQGHTTTTKSDGSYILEDLVAGIYTIKPSTPSQNDYMFIPGFRTVDLLQGDDATDKHFRAQPIPGATDPPPLPETGKPWIKELRSCYTGPFFVAGPSVDNRYDAFVDWQGLTPNYADFTLNGNTSQTTAPGNPDDPVSQTYNMGSDLNYGLLGTRNGLKVQAVAQENNETTKPASLYPIGVGLPIWLPIQPAILNPDCIETEVKYRWDESYPDPPFCEGGSCQFTPPNTIPFIGGKSFGIPPTQAGMEIELSSKGTGSAELFGKAGFEIADKEAEGKIFGKGTGHIQQDEGIVLDQASFGLGITGPEVKSPKWPLVDVICDAAAGGICPLKEAETIPLVGSIIKKFNEKAYAQATAEPGLELAFNFHNKADNSGLEWENGEGTGKVKLVLTIIIDILKNKLSAEGYGGGAPSITLQAPANPSYLKEIALELFSGLKLKVWRWENEWNASYKTSYQPGQNNTQLASASPETLALTHTGWQPIPRHYGVEAANYAVFQANQQSQNSLSAQGEGLGAFSTQETLISANVFPDGHPAIAVNGSTLLLWNHDDTSKPLMQGEEIYYSRYNGTSWSTPTGITDDDLQDFTPQVAFDGSGQAIAVWERNKTLQSETSELNADYANAFEIAYAVWDGSTWGTPTLLTNNNALDHEPLLVRGNDGTLLLIWRQNSSGELLGTAATPDTFFYAFWDGSNWSTPQALLNNANGVIGLTAARHDANTMSIVYNQDTDGDLGTSDDEELYHLSWNGSGWSNPNPLTTDSQSDDRPTLFYDSSGNPRLLWLKGDTLYSSFGSLTGTPQAVVVETAPTILDYAATQDNDGNLVLVWQSYSDEGVDVFYATYDQVHNVFSLVQQLTYDEPLEKFMAPTFAPTGEMVMAYNKTDLVTETVTVSPTLIIENVTTFGQTDLYVLNHSFGPDLSLTAPDLSIDPTNPTLGSTAQINATLHNVGDHAVINPEVTFYLGNPNNGGTLINTASANLTLTGGMSTILSVDWIVPSSGAPFQIYAVADPNDLVTELNETNNTANFFTVVPDLTFDRIKPAYANTQIITVTATLNNVGGGQSAPADVFFRLDDPITGTVIATRNSGNLAAGNQTDIQAVWDATSTPDGRYKIYTVADPINLIVEADETNNDEWGTVELLPDLVLDSNAVLTGKNGDSSLISVWVFNTGIRDANNVTLGIYSQLPQADDTPQIATTLDIPAGEHRVANLNLGAFSLTDFYIGVGISGEIDDRDVSDNLLLVGNAPFFVPGGGEIYLPAIFKSATAPTPDLIVEQITTTSNNVEVVIKNTGYAPASGGFWVDAYINPNPPPTQVNQIWNDQANQGLVWGVDATIAPGETLTLTINDAYYFPQWSNFSTLPEGTPVYVQVDSVNFDTTYGAILETHEATGGSYNNIASTVSTAGSAAAISPGSATAQQPISADGLPSRQ